MTDLHNLWHQDEGETDNAIWCVVWSHQKHDPTQTQLWVGPTGPLQASVYMTPSTEYIIDIEVPSVWTPNHISVKPWWELLQLKSF